MPDRIRKVIDFFHSIKHLPDRIESQLLLQGRSLAETMREKRLVNSLSEVEFRVFSQFGDDGIIQWLIYNLEIPNRTFIEFGVADYRESNTRFLMMNNNWTGFVMDGSPQNISRIKRSSYYWRHSLEAKSAFIDRDNINDLLRESDFDPEAGLLHIDLDGMDYWIWESVSVVTPVILVLEYNSVFGRDRAVTVPYDAQFSRSKAHFSHLYWGASLAALQHLSVKKGYRFVGSNSAGNNAYFVRADKLNSVVKETTFGAGYVESMFRESRDCLGNLSYAAGANRLELIRGLPVYNVVTEHSEPL